MNPKDVYLPSNITNNNMYALFSAGSHLNGVKIFLITLNILMTVELSSLKIGKNCSKPEKVICKKKIFLILRK